MVRKTNTNRVWQSKKQNSLLESGISLNLQSSVLEEEQSSDSKENPSEQNKINSKVNQMNFQQKKYEISDRKQFRESDRNQKVTHFEVTQKLIDFLNAKIYKEIVLTQFIQTNLNSEIQGSSTNQNENKSSHQTLSFKVRNEQISTITDFIFNESLQIAPYFQPFKRNKFHGDDEKEQFKTNTKISTSISNKRHLLTYLNGVLLEPTCIKYLNIYGPTGSGKTFTLKSIIAREKFMDNVIWINGMNIIRGKTKRFISDLKEKFDSVLWQFYKKESEKEGFNQEGFIIFFFNKRNEKVLILDEYDQINDFELMDLLKYAYIKGFQNSSTEKIKLFRISKVIFVSNSFESSLEFESKDSNVLKIAQKKSLYIQHLIFKPFTQKQAEFILHKKIMAVNQQFVQGFASEEEFKQIFEKPIKGVFPDHHLIHIVKKVSMSEEIDIRKLLHFYVNSFKKWIEFLAQTIENPIKKPSKGSILKLKEFLVDANFLQKQSFMITISHKPVITNQNDSNSLLFYLSQIQTEGKSILKAIYETLKLKKKLLDTEIIKQTQRNDRQKVNTGFISQIDAKSKLSNEKRRQSTLRIMDFIKRVRPKIQLHKIYPWIYEWEQIGLIKVRKGITQKNFQAQVGVENSNKIKISDNFLIEVLDKTVIQKGLGLSY